LATPGKKKNYGNMRLELASCNSWRGGGEEECEWHDHVTEVFQMSSDLPRINGYE
jgi:hypothetical protein